MRKSIILNRIWANFEFDASNTFKSLRIVEQKAGKLSGTTKEQLEGLLSTNAISWQ